MSSFPDIDPLRAKRGYKDNAGGELGHANYNAILLYSHKLSVDTVLGLTRITSPEIIMPEPILYLDTVCRTHV